MSAPIAGEVSSLPTVMPNPPPEVVVRPAVPRVMKPHIALEYLGFSSAGDRRQYRLQIREGGEIHPYTVSIANAAFSDGRAHLQDGPDICYLRMQREMLAFGLLGPTALDITDAELVAYRTAHTPVPRGRPRPPVAPALPKEVRS
jgi:hypothetical protein